MCVIHWFIVSKWLCELARMIKQRPTTFVHLIHPMQVHKFEKSTILSSINRAPDLSKERRQVGHTSRQVAHYHHRNPAPLSKVMKWTSICLKGNRYRERGRKAACWMHSWPILTPADHWPDNVLWLSVAKRLKSSKRAWTMFLMKVRSRKRERNLRSVRYHPSLM